MKVRLVVGAMLLVTVAIGGSGCTQQQMQQNAGNAGSVLVGSLTKGWGGVVEGGINLVNDNMLGGNKVVRTVGKIAGMGVNASTGNYVAVGLTAGQIGYDALKKKNQAAPAAETGGQAQTFSSDNE